MTIYFIAAGVMCIVACVVVSCARSLIAAAMRRYPRIRAAVHVGRSGFYIEADGGCDAGEPMRGQTRLERKRCAP